MTEFKHNPKWNKGYQADSVAIQHKKYVESGTWRCPDNPDSDKPAHHWVIADGRQICKHCSEDRDAPVAVSSWSLDFSAYNNKMANLLAREGI